MAQQEKSRFNDEYFVLKRQLEAETRKKLMSLPDADDNAPVYVMDWWSSETGIYAFGCDARLNVAKMRVDVEPGLYATTNNYEVLSTVCDLLGCKVRAFPEFVYTSNNFAPYDILSDPELADRPSYLVKITTGTFREATDLFRRFSKDEKAYRYVHVPLYWSETNLVMFERLLRHHEPGRAVSYALPKMIARWFDKSLNCYLTESPRIPIITFDIETVSTDANRVPTGEHADDELFTVSIHHMHTQKLYTLIYLPLTATVPSDMKRLVLTDEYPQDYHKVPSNRVTENVVECFASEKALLERTLTLLQADPSGSKLHYLIGYNSLGYDIKYLFLRAKFYNLPEFERFVYREGYAYGLGQMHLDLFRIMMMRYKMKNFKLSHVSKVLLQETKTGVDAVQLRFTFHAMRSENRYYTHEESVAWPSVRDILHYNNYDTILVSKLVDKFGPIDFVLKQSDDCKISIFALNTNYNRMQYKLWSKCFVVGLNMGIFFGSFKSSHACIKHPANWECTDFYEHHINLESQLNSSDYNDLRDEGKKAKYPGGANFCLGEFMVDNVEVLDYRIAYPLFIERMNVSDETATILPARVILNLSRRLTTEQRAQYKTYDYMTHTGASKSATAILYHQYIYNNLYCGKEFQFLDSELQLRGNSPVIIIWVGRRGVLSEIISQFNIAREDTKNLRKSLDAAISAIENRLSNVREEQAAIDALEQEIRDADLEKTDLCAHRSLSTQTSRGSDSERSDVHAKNGYDECESSDTLLGERVANHDRGEHREITGAIQLGRVASNAEQPCASERGAVSSEQIARDEADNDEGDFGGAYDRDDDESGSFGEFGIRGDSDTVDEDLEDGDFGADANETDDDDGTFGAFGDDSDENNNDHDEGDFDAFCIVGDTVDDDDGNFGDTERLPESNDVSDARDTEHNSGSARSLDGLDTGVLRARDANHGAVSGVRALSSSAGGGDTPDRGAFGFTNDRDEDSIIGSNDVHVEPRRVCRNAEMPGLDHGTMVPSDRAGASNKRKCQFSDTKRKQATLDVFSFKSDLIVFHPNGAFDFNERKLSGMPYAEQLDKLEHLLGLVTAERDTYQNSYELQKSIVASIYGCIGRAAKVPAAITTNGIRRSILESAQFVANLGYSVYYIDTDSLFIKHPTETKDISPELNARFPHTEIERKMYKRCLFVQKKIYYSVSDDELRYSQNVNGSPAWKEFIYFAYKQSHVKTNGDIYKLFVDFFTGVYDNLLSFDRITPELLQLITKEVKLAATYKNNNERSKLKQFLRANYPTIASNYRQTIYYQFNEDIKSTELIPAVHLKSIDQLHTVNLFKFYHNVFKTVFNIIKFHVKKNNEPFVITLDAKPVLLTMISAYLDVYRAKFPQQHVDSVTLGQINASDLESEFDRENSVIERIDLK